MLHAHSKGTPGRFFSACDGLAFVRVKFASLQRNVFFRGSASQELRLSCCTPRAELLPFPPAMAMVPFEEPATTWRSVRSSAALPSPLDSSCFHDFRKDCGPIVRECKDRARWLGASRTWTLLLGGSSATSPLPRWRCSPVKGSLASLPW